MGKNCLLYTSGHIYSLPTVDISATGKLDFKQWINTKWLDEMGMEIPTTLDEFKEVLLAFRDQDPNGNGEQDEIPLGLRDPNTVYQLGGPFGLGYQMRDTYNIDENGTVHNWLCDDAFKEYLIYLNDLYEEGLIWQDYYKNDRAAWRKMCIRDSKKGIFTRQRQPKEAAYYFKKRWEELPVDYKK